MGTLATDDGVKLYYEDCGEGTPIVFVHEFAGDHRSWEPQVRYFARRYRCITYSARGYAPSEVPAGIERYSQERWCEDVRCVMDALALPAAHVVGLSMGAFATLHFGMRYCARGAPARALSLTLAGCGSGAHPADHESFRVAARALADTIEREGMAHMAATYGHGPARVQFRNKDPRGFAEAIAQLAQHSAAGSADTRAAAGARAIRQRPAHRSTAQGANRKRPAPKRSPKSAVAPPGNPPRARRGRSRRRRPLAAAGSSWH